MSNKYEEDLARLKVQMAEVMRTQTALCTAVQNINAKLNASSHDLGQTDLVVSDNTVKIPKNKSLLQELTKK